MKRRTFIASAGACAFAGCSTAGDTDPETGPSDGEPEAKPKSDDPEAVAGVEHALEFGDWYEDTGIGVRVDGIETTQTVVNAKDGAEIDLPAGEALAMVDFVIKNLDEDTYVPTDRLAIAADGDLYESEGSIEGVEACWMGECYDHLDLDWTQKDEQRDRLTLIPEVEHGAKREFWIGAVVPDDVDQLAAIYDSSESVDSFDVSWS